MAVLPQLPSCWDYGVCQHAPLWLQNPQVTCFFSLWPPGSPWRMCHHSNCQCNVRSSLSTSGILVLGSLRRVHPDGYLCETGSHYIARCGLKLRSSCLSLPVLGWQVLSASLWVYPTWSSRNILTFLVLYLSSDCVSSHCSFQSLNAFIVFLISHAIGPREALFISSFCCPDWWFSFVSVLPWSLSSCARSQFQYFHLEVGFWDTVLLCNSDWPETPCGAQTCNRSPASTSPILGLRCPPAHLPIHLLLSSLSTFWPLRVFWLLIRAISMSVSVSVVFPPEPPSSDAEWYGHGLTEAEGFNLVELTLFEPAFCQLDPNSASIPDTKTRHCVYLDLPYLWPKGPLLVQFPLVC